jgi:collagenase-like PrtC family protease
MRLSVGTNFDDRLVEEVKDMHVEVFYGKMSADIVGGGRPTFALPTIDKQRVEDHVKTIHSHGMKFNYLLNAVCLDNMETTKEFNLEIRKLMEWLGEMKVDYVTVSIPMLIDMAKDIIPDTKISLSTFAGVETISQVKYFEDRGVSEITLTESKNRDFTFLEKLRETSDMGFQLIATNDCLMHCPMRFFHPNFQSHASQSNHSLKGYALDYCMLRCTHDKMQHPEELLKAPWIRPEDMHIYEALGFDKFKLTERMKTTDKIAMTVKSYANRSYDGNLLRLLNTRLQEDDFEMPKFGMNMSGEHIPAEKMVPIFRLIFALKASIPNNKLDGFLEGFKTRDCKNLDCDKCGYCKAWADKTVEMSDETLQAMKDFNHYFDEIASGKIFESEEENRKTELIMEWPEETLNILKKMIDLKPEPFRVIAEKDIKKHAQRLAEEGGETQVLPLHIAKANILSTPDDFKHFAKTDVKSLGFDLQQVM